tara:strand:- start:352 stop:771 length:420 start_codon:yes stop_codon:yes gene_type:complete
LKNNFSDKDNKDWEDFLSRNEKLPNKDLEIIEKKNFKIKAIDLHGYSIENANKVIEDFIINSYEDGFNKLKIVTGKGLHSQNEKNPYVSKDLSILKYSVPDFIQKNKKLINLINEISDAKIEDGGSGAFYIYLKKNKKK